MEKQCTWRRVQKYLKAPAQHDGFGAAEVASELQYHLLQVIIDKCVKLLRDRHLCRK